MPTATDIRRNPGISVKLSALHPRYEVAQKETMLPVMAERLLSLALAARHARMGLNIDAEEADRLDLSLDVIERVLAEPELAGWNGFGVVVQAYGPRAAFVIDWLYALAQEARPQDHGAAGQGRLLGHRDQAGADARARRLSGLHAQGQHRRLLHRHARRSCCR